MGTLKRLFRRKVNGEIPQPEVRIYDYSLDKRRSSYNKGSPITIETYLDSVSASLRNISLLNSPKKYEDMSTVQFKLYPQFIKKI